MNVPCLFQKTFTSRAARAACAALGAGLLTVAVGSAHAAVGARVLVQEWNPMTPDQQRVVTLVNDASVVSDAVQRAWNEARPRLCAQLKATMGKGGAAGGQTLRDIDCVLDPVANFSVASAGKNALTIRLAIGGYVAATSTTPTVLGSYADPRFSLGLTGHMLMTLSVQPDINQTLRFDRVVFSLSDANIDSHNFSGDILKFVVDDLIPFFRGPNFKRMAENAINSLSIDVAGLFNTALAPVNVKLRGPSGLVRVGVWGKPDAIVVAFAPREVTPPGGGTLSGSFHAAPNLPVSLKQQSPDCAAMVITASVQTGPAPLLDPGGMLGDAPMRQVGSFSAQPSGAGECRYRIVNLAAGLPHKLQTRSCKQAKFALRGEGWNGHLITPNPSVERNFIMESPLACVDVAVLQNNKPTMRVDPGDPGVRFSNPALAVLQHNVLQGQAATPATAVVVATPVRNAAFASTAPATTSAAFAAAAPAQTTSTLNRTSLVHADRVSLNPQPLPPGGGQAGARVSLNPQPLPPRSFTTVKPMASTLNSPTQAAAPAVAPQQGALNWGAAPR